MVGDEPRRCRNGLAVDGLSAHAVCNTYLDALARPSRDQQGPAKRTAKAWQRPSSGLHGPAQPSRGPTKACRGLQKPAKGFLGPAEAGKRPKRGLQRPAEATNRPNSGKQRLAEARKSPNSGQQRPSWPDASLLLGQPICRQPSQLALLCSEQPNGQSTLA